MRSLGTSSTVSRSEPPRSAAAAATAGGTAVSRESQRTRLSRAAEEHGRDEREYEADAADVVRPPPLPRELEPAGDDQHGADHQRSAQRLAEKDERDGDRDERGGAQHDRRA